MLAGFPDARRPPGAHHLDLIFQRQKLAMQAQDPAVRPQLALPVSTLVKAVAMLQSQHTPKTAAIADLITIAFYYLLRVGEYTYPRQHTLTRTVQFQCQDVRLWHRGQLLSHNLPLHVLLLADGATLYIQNQKNGHKGDTLHHDAVTGEFCPVKALVRRLVAIRQITPTATAPLSMYSVSHHVQSIHISAALKKAAVMDGLPLHGYDIRRVGPHSLRASGAMACKLNGVDQLLLQKMGRWTSTTFLTYIHAQIGQLTSGIAQRMATRLTFTNVGG